MSRILFFIVVVVVIYWLLKSYRKQLPGEDAHDQAISGKGAASQAEDMVRCAHCGLHLPKGEGVVAGNRYFCCEAHRRLHMEKSDQS